MLLGPKAPSHSTYRSPIPGKEGKEKQRRKEDGRERERERKKSGLGQVILNQEITKDPII